MGLGDELMAAGEARRRAAGTARRFRMIHKNGQPKWHHLWEGHPNIARPGEPFDEDLPAYIDRLRPYLQATTPNRFVFREYAPAPSPAIRLDPRSRALASHTTGAIVFHAGIKDRASPNKQWPAASWKALLGLGVGLRWVQIGEPGSQQRLHGAEVLVTNSFVEACGAISGARAVVTHEGGLHHAAAAMGVPAVVIRGGFISPRVTGYAGQKDLYVESEAWPLGCGMRVRCRHCDQAMTSISPPAVLAALNELLAEPRAA